MFSSIWTMFRNLCFRETVIWNRCDFTTCSLRRNEDIYVVTCTIPFSDGLFHFSPLMLSHQAFQISSYFFQMFISCYISLNPNYPNIQVLLLFFCSSFLYFISNGTKLLLWRGISYLLVSTVLGYLCSSMFHMNWGRRCQPCLSIQFLQYHKHLYSE